MSMSADEVRIVAWLEAKVCRLSAAIARDPVNHYVPDADIIVRLALNWADAIRRGDHRVSRDDTGATERSAPPPLGTDDSAGGRNGAVTQVRGPASLKDGL